MSKTYQPQWNDLMFRLSEVRAHIEHALNATEHRAYFGDETGPALWWVKDQGTYFMSNGVGERPEVAYAKGYSDADDCWDELQDICGGDDFAEVFGNDVMSLVKNAPFADGWVVLTVDDGEVGIAVVPA